MVTSKFKKSITDMLSIIMHLKKYSTIDPHELDILLILIKALLLIKVFSLSSIASPSSLT